VDCTDAPLGVLLVGHGTREAAGLGEFFQAARLVAAGAGAARVEWCLLEFAEPTLAQGFEALAARGVERVVVVPVLLFSAGHAERDIPAAIAAAARAQPQLVIDQAAHLGCHADIIELSHQRYREIVSSEPAVPAEQTVLVMVGRGSHCASATAEMFELVELRRRRSQLANARACFIAMAEPSLTHALEQAARSGARRIVVQPHLLFAGLLLDRLGDAVALYAKRYSDSQWLTTSHLGPSELVASALLDRAVGMARSDA
jgi:sirohydrochlorin ferrochelatase